MASIVNDPGGCKRILVIVSGKRRAVRIGPKSKKDADKFQDKIERLADAVNLGHSPDPDTVKWLAEVEPKIRKRLEKAGLVRAGAGNVTLDVLLTKYAETANVKGSTKLIHDHARRNLREYFSAGKMVREITSLDGDEWRQWLKDNEKLATATISKRVKLARQFFAKGVKWKMVAENPFAEVKAGPQTNSARQYFLSRTDAQKILDACPDAQWRLLFALSRFGGLRCPSEHLLLTWGDIDWEKGRIRVTSPKTEHHEGGDTRTMPLFPELRGPLMEVFEEAEPGATFVITRYRDRNQNLRTQLKRIIKRAGLDPWPKLFHNLRATRQTELEEYLPSHVVCAWLGNSPQVARAHYLQVTDEHFEKAAHIPAQHTPAEPGKASQSSGNGSEKTPVLPSGATACDEMRRRKVALVGAELPANSNGNSTESQQGGAPSGALADLARQLAALSSSDRAAILAALNG